MKGKTLSTLGIVFAAIGVVLILCYRSITSTGVVVTGGILFVAVGLVNLIVFSQGQKEGGLSRLLSQITNAAAIVLGICMLVFESTFTPLVTFIFGLLVAVCALWQFFLLALGTRPHQLPGWLYLFPLLLVGGSIYIFMQSRAMDHVIMLATGIAMAVMGVGCIVEGSALGMARRSSQRQDTVAEAARAGADEGFQPQKDEKMTTDDLDAPLKEPEIDQNSTK